jgi:adenylyl-sulfate kinase
MNKVFWLFGRSGAGKSTLAGALKRSLADKGLTVVLLEGDVLRNGLCRDLGYSTVDRVENHRRIAEVARILTSESVVVLVATMAPEYAQRDAVKKVLDQNLEWIFIDAPIDVCIQRDPKGLYRKARDGQVSDLINYPFAAPRSEEMGLVVHTAVLGIDDCHQRLHRFVFDRLPTLSAKKDGG